MNDMNLQQILGFNGTELNKNLIFEENEKGVFGLFTTKCCSSKDDTVIFYKNGKDFHHPTNSNYEIPNHGFFAFLKETNNIECAKGGISGKYRFSNGVLQIIPEIWEDYSSLFSGIDSIKLVEQLDNLNLIPKSSTHIINPA